MVCICIEYIRAGVYICMYRQCIKAWIYSRDANGRGRLVRTDVLGHLQEQLMRVTSNRLS